LTGLVLDDLGMHGANPLVFGYQGGTLFVRLKVIVRCLLELMHTLEVAKIMLLPFIFIGMIRLRDIGAPAAYRIDDFVSFAFRFGSFGHFFLLTAIA